MTDKLQDADVLTDADGKNKEQKSLADTDKDSFYFSFYSNLQNQANMIGDVSRTGTYRKAILGNAAVAIHDKTVLDVGAGSGVLSYMAAQAGAKEVIALEASSMADKMQLLVDQANQGEANEHLANKVRIVRGMVEDKYVQEAVLKGGKVDTIVSEPIGVMLLHERMVESFLLARDLFLKPGGSILPSAGHIHFCPFSDEGLFNETEQKAQFFNQTLFGTDFHALYAAAREEAFAQPVVGIFPPTSLMAAPCQPKTFDFYTCAVDDLLEFTIPVDFVVSRTAIMHGLASWFDLDFDAHESTKPQEPNTEADDLEQAAWAFPIPTAATFAWMGAEQPLNPGVAPEAPRQGLKVTLSTGPNATRTHWQQARLLLPDPLAVNRGERVVGSVRFKVNNARSYDLTVDVAVDRGGVPPPAGPEPNPLRRAATYHLQHQTFNYSYTGESAWDTARFTT